MSKQPKLIPGVSFVAPILVIGGLDDVSKIVTEAEVKQVIDAFVETERVATERTALKRGHQNRFKTAFSEARAGQPFKDPALDDVSYQKRLNGLAARIHDLNWPLIAVCTRVLSDIDPFLRKAFNEREAIERAESARYGIGFTQSQILRTIFAKLQSIGNSLDALRRLHQVSGTVPHHCWLMHCQEFIHLSFPELSTSPAVDSLSREPAPQPAA